MNALAAVVLCAGKGTRMRSERSKVLHPLLGRPLAYYPLARAIELGAEPVVTIVGHDGERVREELTAQFPNAALRFAIQSEQRGTGHAVACAREALGKFSGDVLILYGDVPLVSTATLAALRKASVHGDARLTLITCRTATPHGYGRILRDDKGAVTGIVEERDATPSQRAITEVNAGIYIVEAKFLFSCLDDLTPNTAQGELYLTDVVAMAAKQGGVRTVEARLEEVLGVNSRVDLAERSDQLRARINREKMESGVTLLHPSSTFIDEGIEIGLDTVIGPQVTLSGRCTIGRGVSIGQGCILQNSTVGDNAKLRPYSVLESATVGAGCNVGPFARLRAGTRLDEGAQIGNFVETKEAHLGAGTKANHLAYLGDAEIGPGCNIGAGTITCNYDGVAKHPTRLGAGVFVGSDSQFVAPVEVGDGAFIAAGSTIVDNVPSQALAISRTPQSNREGWAERRRAANPTKKGH